MDHSSGTLGQVAPYIQDLGVYAGVVTATLLAFGALSRLRLVRFAMRKLIGEPIVNWVQTAAVEPALAKHGQEMKAEIRLVVGEHTDREEGIARELRDEMRTTFSNRTADFNELVAAGVARVEGLERGQQDLKDQITELSKQVG